MKYLSFLFLPMFVFVTPVFSEPSISLSDSGIGQISIETPFDIKAIKKLLPKLIVEESEGATEGESYPIIKISDKKGLLLIVNPGYDQSKIYSIVVKSNRVENELGPAIGDTFIKVYGKDISKITCSPGMEEMSGTVSCPDPNPKSQNIEYVFAGSWNGPDGAVPPVEVLNNWQISMIVWSPQ